MPIRYSNAITLAFPAEKSTVSARFLRGRWMMALRKDIETAINCASAENGSDTPDFILAEYLTDCLWVYDKAVNAREKWYGRGKPMTRPTIEELEKILADPDSPPVRIMPDGSITAA